ncbi:hypothetical protein [Candidatus Hodgkinia cicadicola]
MWWLVLIMFGWRLDAGMERLDVGINRMDVGDGRVGRLGSG